MDKCGTNYEKLVRVAGKINILSNSNASAKKESKIGIRGNAYPSMIC